MWPPKKFRKNKQNGGWPPFWFEKIPHPQDPQPIFFPSTPSTSPVITNTRISPNGDFSTYPNIVFLL